MAKKFPHSYEVCTCRHVSLGEIVHAIKEKDAKTMGDIQDFTDAGTACRCCICEEGDVGKTPKELYLKEILAKISKS